MDIIVLTGLITSSDIALSSNILGDIFWNVTHPFGKWAEPSNMYRYSATNAAACDKHMADSV